MASATSGACPSRVLSSPSSNQSTAWDAPEVVSRGIVRWRALAASMFVIGAVATEVGLAAPGVSTASPWVAHVAAALFLVQAAATWTIPLSRYRIATLLNVGASIALITAFIALARGIEGIEVFYLWPMLGAAYLLRRREVLGFGMCSLGGYAFALSVAPGIRSFPVGRFLLVAIASSVVVLTVRLLSENLQRLVGRLRTTSSTDPLTGLLNRRSFDRRFAQAMEEASQFDRPLTAMLLDLDHFKRVNDEHGHAVGDHALKRFAELLARESRASDLVARVGGEEFAVVLPGARLEQAVGRAEHVARAWRQDRAVNGLALTVSVGVATRLGESDAPDALLRRADAAVYRAKAGGRDRVVLADEDGELRPADGQVDRRGSAPDTP